MNNRERRNERRPGFNVGSASIIMIFSVLCLTIFAVLSLVTTNSDLKLSTRAAKSIEDYYAAEYAAETKVLEVKEALGAEGTPTQRLQKMDVDVIEREDGGAKIRFTQNVDARRDLRVELELDADGKLSISKWSLEANANWNPDDSISLWSGTDA